MTITLHGTNGVTTAGITLGSTAIASTGAELNILDGVTSTAAELNILDGVTSTAAELNLLDGVTSTTAELNILDGVTSTAAELNILDGVTTTAAEINLIDGGTARGTTAVADGDGVLINDAGTMRMTTVDTLATYVGTKVEASDETSVVTLPTDGGSITFSNIPDGIKSLRLIVYQANLDTANKNYLVQLGDSGAIHTTDGDYSSRSQEMASATRANETAGMIILYNTSVNSSNKNHIVFHLYKQTGTNIFLSNHIVSLQNKNLTVIGTGTASGLDSRLTRLVFRTTGGNFTSGTANLQWSY